MEAEYSEEMTPNLIVNGTKWKLDCLTDNIAVKKRIRSDEPETSVEEQFSFHSATEEMIIDDIES
jgi:hypothetical protein